MVCGVRSIFILRAWRTFGESGRAGLAESEGQWRFVHSPWGVGEASTEPQVGAKIIFALPCVTPELLTARRVRGKDDLCPTPPRGAA